MAMRWGGRRWMTLLGRRSSSAKFWSRRSAGFSRISCRYRLSVGRLRRDDHSLFGWPKEMSISLFLIGISRTSKSRKASSKSSVMACVFLYRYEVGVRQSNKAPRTPARKPALDEQPLCAASDHAENTNWIGLTLYLLHACPPG